MSASKPRGPVSGGSKGMQSIILSAATRILVPAILAMALFLFWRGHNEPGGGFVGGLMAAAAVALVARAEGRDVAARRLRFEPVSIAAFGLACSVAAGIWGGLATGHFLKGMWPLITIAPDGSKSGLPFGSIMLFDAGVFLVVLGAVSGLLFAFEDAVETLPDPKADEEEG